MEAPDSTTEAVAGGQIVYSGAGNPREEVNTMTFRPPPKDHSKGWSTAEFEKYRTPLTDFLRARVVRLLEDSDCRRIMIRAPVKSGKREMVEYLAVRDMAVSPQRVHAFISAFHRVADEEQRKELNRHNMRVFSLCTKTKVRACTDWISEQIAAGKSVVLHLDECDFGSGEKQNLGQIYKLVSEEKKVTTILYSATPEEVLFSGEVEENEYNDMLGEFVNSGHWINYVPPATFCGPEKFLNEKLVFEATPFFRKDKDKLMLTKQGKMILDEVSENAKKGNGRNIMILRLSYSVIGGLRHERKENKSFYQFLYGYNTIPELGKCIVIVDKEEKAIPVSSSALSQKIGWSKADYWCSLTETKPIVIVIDQTSSRSTQWMGHNRIAVYHDFRNVAIFNTISQAQERVNHYSTQYPNGFQPIKVYGHLKTFQLSASQIDYEKYMNHEWEKKKVDRRSLESDEPMYKIQKTNAPHTIHPEYPDPVSHDNANNILQELGCYVDTKISSRVRGNVRNKRVFEAEFIPCSEKDFPVQKTKLDKRFRMRRGFENPFERCRNENKMTLDGKYMGCLRVWRVFDYETDILPQKGWGVLPDIPRLTICYKNDILGIALRFDTGNVETVSTLVTHKSMYRS